jgi:hypothetical protein
MSTKATVGCFIAALIIGVIGGALVAEWLPPDPLVLHMELEPETTKQSEEEQRTRQLMVEAGNKRNKPKCAEACDDHGGSIVNYDHRMPLEYRCYCHEKYVADSYFWVYGELGLGTRIRWEANQVGSKQ